LERDLGRGEMEELQHKAQKIKLLITDCDGVLTDGGVYYSANGEELKKFNLRDGMGVERLRKICGIDTGIMTGENSPIVARRAEKLQMKHLFLGIKDKKQCLTEILPSLNISPDEIAYIGDDMNDYEVIKMVGLSASPADGFGLIKETVDYICSQNGGDGAFREFAEWIIMLRANAI
jgi:3-deoxy-D-manno-octulosonate 8-phosphate phosphatase (KDO 8-P phosphatase)